MEDVEQFRRAVAYAARDSALHKPDAAIQSAQNKARDYASDIAGLPVDPTAWTPIQNLDPTSTSYGLFYPTTNY